MGRSRVIPYTIHVRMVSGARHTPSEWRIRSSRLAGPGHGKPSTENIDKWVTGLEDSMINGCNKHLGIDQVVEAEVRHHGEVVATWKRRLARPNQPMFQVIDVRS